MTRAEREGASLDILEGLTCIHISNNENSAIGIYV